MWLLVTNLTRSRIPSDHICGRSRGWFLVTLAEVGRPVHNGCHFSLLGGFWTLQVDKVGQRDGSVGNDTCHTNCEPPVSTSHDRLCPRNPKQEEVLPQVTCLQKLFKRFYVVIYVCLSMNTCVSTSEEGIRSSGSGYESADVCAGNRTQVLWKSRKHS